MTGSGDREDADMSQFGDALPYYSLEMRKQVNLP